MTDWGTIYNRHLRRGDDHGYAAFAADQWQRRKEKKMGDKTKGLYRKFEVYRSDGTSAPGQKHHGCEYFVLDMDHDPFAIQALYTYADACEIEYPLLAADIRQKISR